MRPYSPFQKELSKLQPHDLAQLREASEGWYIEYKQEAPNASTIAKSISALAACRTIGLPLPDML